MTLALRSDRNWLVSGTIKGYIALWDARFPQPVKLWRHNWAAVISRLATSCVLTPQHWGSTEVSGAARPFIFVASGPNECGMFDILSGDSRGCFREVEGDSQNLNGHVEEPPLLEAIHFSTHVEGRKHILSRTIEHE